MQAEHEVEAVAASRSRRTSPWGWLIGGLLFSAAVAAIAPNFIGVTDCYTPENTGKQGLRAVQLALERYATDNQAYPPELGQLQAELYMPRFPRNGFIRGRGDEPAMRPLSAGDPPSPGDFVYLPRLESGGQRVVGYQLCLYGKDEHAAKEPYVYIPEGIAAGWVIFMLDSAGYAAERAEKRP